MFKVLFSALSFFLIALALPVETAAQDVVLYEEYFDNLDTNGVPINWIESLSPSLISVINGEYKITVPINEPNALSYINKNNWQVNSIEVDVTGLSGPDRFILFRYDYLKPGRQGYVFKWYESFYLNRVELLGKEDEICNQVSSYSTQLNSPQKIKVEAVENIINFYINNTLIFTCTDNTPIYDGGFGIFLHPSGSRDPQGNWYLNSVSYDNLIIKGKYITKKFNLPIDYWDRNNPTQSQFQNTFWSKMTASFDHNKLGNQFIPFTTTPYEKKDCLKNDIGIKCYDSHNGTDFAPTSYGSKEFVYPVADGKIVYASEKDKNGKCNPEKSGYGCVIVMYHPDLDVYTLYAHLSEIYKFPSETVVKFSEQIGKMGNTGCYPCGVHIHLGVLKDKTSLNNKKTMTASDWESLFSQIEPKNSSKEKEIPKHYCTYKVPNGNILSFQDPSGWGNDSKQDPWAISKELGSCGTTSPYLWIHDVGTNRSSDVSPSLWYSEELN
jgi:hypothetical protein